MRLTAAKLLHHKKRNGGFLKDVNMILWGEKKEGSSLYVAESL